MSATQSAPPSVAGQAAERPPAIVVEGLSKTFRIPHRQVSTLKERVLHPFARAEHEELRVLDDVSFAVGRGEFFGIVGRNGSGKSTLLKCLAGIYRADAGRIRVAGALAPFIELGVGFNPDLTARDNVLINAVMMGLSPLQARARFASILAFAELEDFVDLKLKNYSSGMQVRLAFSTMVHTDADVLLIDEVLAVGDAAFQQKCFGVFEDLRDRGRTIVLVTHDMETVERFCHRAMLVAGGRIAAIGDPDSVAAAYLERNVGPRGAPAPAAAPEPEPEPEPAPAPALGPSRAALLDMWLEDAEGERVEALPVGAPFAISCTWELQAPVPASRFDVWIDSEDPTRVYGTDAYARAFAASTIHWREGPGDLRAGERVHVRVRAHHRLADGRYHVGCSVLSGPGGEDVVALELRALSFTSYGDPAVYGLARMEHELTVERER